MLSVFENVCNLINTENDVLSISVHALGMGPFSLGVRPVDFRRWVQETSAAVVHGEDLRVGVLAIETSPAETWDPVPPWRDFHNLLGFDRSWLPALRQTLLQYAPPGSLAGLLTERPQVRGLDRAILEAARAATAQLLAGLRSDDLERSLRAVRELAGLGGGLTPAGDDWILGCILALWGSEDADRAEIWGAAMAAAAGPRTTLLSAAWLRAAASGACSEQWHELLHALLDGNAVEVRRAGKKLVHLGHTSGADSLAGFLAYLSEG